MEARHLLAAHLTLQLNTVTVDEGAGNGAITATLQRVEAPDLTVAQEVTISINASNELSFPSSVSIPANQASTTFTIDTINDGLIDGAAMVILAASAAGFDSGSVVATVNDDDSVADRIIGGNLTGTLAQGSYSVSHNLKVPEGSSLTINPGATVLFSARQQWEVEGSLSAVGSAANPITFGSDAAMPARGDWVGFRITSDDQQGATVFAETVITHATYGIAILGNNALVTIRESDIGENSNSAVLIDDDNGAGVVVRNNDLHDNNDHGILLLASDSVCNGVFTPISIEANDIGPNAKSGIYLRAMATSSCGTLTAPEILRNRIHDNDVGIAGNLANSGINRGELKARIESNFIYDNSKEGLNFSAIPSGAGFVSQLNNNTIVSNGTDGVLHTNNTGTEFQLLNNIIQSNSRGVVASTNYVPVNNSVGFNNVFGNSAGNFLRYPITFGQATTSNVHGTPSDAEFNISVDSAFEADNLHIRVDSPMVQAGSGNLTVGPDFDGELRATPSDIGADEVSKLSMSFPTLNVTEGGKTILGTVTRLGRTDLPVVVTLTRSDASEVNVDPSVTIPAGQTSIDFAVAAIDDGLIDGTQTVTLTATATGHLSVASDITVFDIPALTISIAGSPISEGAGATATTAAVFRNTETTNPLTVNLRSSDTTAATVPMTVTIPAGRTFATFNVGAVDDEIVDGTQSVTITVLSAGFEDAVGILEVSDDDVPTLTVEISPATVSEGAGSASATATVSRNVDSTDALIVDLVSDDTTEATVPTSVTIPAGQVSASFEIDAINDDLGDGPQTVMITASASGLSAGSGVLVVLDDEVPTLSVVIAAAAVSEGAGPAATTATVSRNDASTNSLTINLTSDDTTEATVPASVNIPAGQTSVEFNIDAVDDIVADGVQEVMITASAVGFRAAATDTLDVIDDDLAGLTVEIVATSISEGDGPVATMATVSRNSDLTNPITVSLVSNDATEATVPATVTIPAGQVSATFDLAAIDDVILDGTQTVMITASAAGLAAGSGTLSVTDDELEELSIVVAAVSINEGAGPAATIATVARNTDPTDSLTVNLFSDDTTEVTVPATVTIPAGQVSATFNVNAIDDVIIDGTQTVMITASAVGIAPGVGTLDVADNDLAGLSLTIVAASVSEGAGSSATTAIVSRNTDLTNPLTVSLYSGDTTEVRVPPSVMIPAGRASVAFTINAVNDTIVDGTQTVTLSASAPGIADGSDTLDVTDDDLAALSVSIVRAWVNEDAGSAATTATVTRNTDLAIPLTVNLASNDDSEASVPATLTIPIGRASASFSIDAVEDAISDGTQEVIITASADGFELGSDTLDVIDNDPAALSLNIADASVNESAGTAATTVTVFRNTDATDPLSVNLITNDTTEATVPMTVTIPAGETSATFNIDAVDDVIDDGNQTVMITALAAGFAAGNGSLEVVDDDLASLSVSIDDSSINENAGAGATMVTVFRSTIPTDALTVDIVSTSTARLNVPSTVTIPAGQSTVRFSIDAVDNQVVDGTQSVMITASAGLLEGVDTLVVSDDDVPELSFSIEPSSVSEVDGTTVATLERNALFADPIVVTIFNLDDSSNSEDLQVTIPAEEASFSFAIQVVDDALATGDRTITFTATASQFPAAMSSLTILDNDIPELTISLDSSSVGEDGSPITATIERNTLSSLTVMTMHSQDGLVQVPETIEFSEDELSKTFEVVPIDNEVVTGDRSVSISASAVGHSVSSVDLLVVDDEVASLIVNNGDHQRIDVGESGAPVTIDVVLGAQPASDVTVSLQTDVADEFQVQPSPQASLVFTPETWDQPQVITFAPVGDEVVEPTADFVATFAIVAGQSAPEFSALESQTIPLRLEDDDVAGIEIESSNGSTFLSETGLDDSFELRLTGAPESAVTLTFEVAGAPEVSFVPSSISFNEDDWDQLQQVMIDVPSDADFDRASLGDLQVLIADSTTAFGFASLEEPVVELLLVDGVDNDLQLTTADEQVILVDQVSGAVMRGLGADPVGELTTGDKGESILIDPAANVESLRVDTFAGDDTVRISSTQLMELDGGDGFDTLRILGAETIDLSGNALSLVSIELIDLSDADVQSLTLDPLTVAGIAGSNGTLIVSAAEDDVVDVGTGWRADPTRVEGTTTYHQLVSGNVLLELSNGRPWTNPLLSVDVDRSGDATALDALRIINRISLQGDNPVLPVVTESEPVVDYFDVSGEGNATALDALQVINFMARVAAANAEQVVGGIVPVTGGVAFQVAAGGAFADAPNLAVETGQATLIAYPVAAEAVTSERVATWWLDSQEDDDSAVDALENLTLLDHVFKDWRG